MACERAKSALRNGNICSDNDDDVAVSIDDNLLMVEILPRLPVKQLIRSKLVCKKWNSTISSLEFAKLHLKFSYSNNQNRYFFIESRFRRADLKPTIDPCCLIPYAPLVNVNESILLSQAADVTQGESAEMVDSCNGLVCFCHEGDREKSRQCFFILWNPATREHRRIPSPEDFPVSESLDSYSISMEHGFGYVPSLDDYVIAASFWTVIDLKGMFHGFYVFSFREGKWERVLDKSSEEFVDKQLCGLAIMVGDTMFWSSYEGYNVVGFDLVTKEFKVYPWLIWQNGYRVRRLFRVKGCLALLLDIWGNDHVTDFWMLKNASDWCSDHSWQKILSVDLLNISFLTFSETGKCLVRQSEEFKLFDPSKEALESTREDDGVNLYRNLLITKDHIESLISPFAITKADENKW